MVHALRRDSWTIGVEGKEERVYVTTLTCSGPDKLDRTCAAAHPVLLLQPRTDVTRNVNPA